MYSVYLSASDQEKNATVMPGQSEEDLMQALAQDAAREIRRRTGKVEVFLNRPEMTLAEVIDDSNRREPLLHVALHSNAGGGSGTETWACGVNTGGERDTDSVRFARQLQSRVVSALGLPDRGVKDGRVKKFGEVVRVRATSVICELFFHDNPGDMRRFQERYKAAADAVAGSILEWFGVENEGGKEEEAANRGLNSGGCAKETTCWSGC